MWWIFFLVVINIVTDSWEQGIALLLSHGRKHTLIECYFELTCATLLKATNANIKAEDQHDNSKHEIAMSRDN